MSYLQKERIQQKSTSQLINKKEKIVTISHLWLYILQCGFYMHIKYILYA